MSKFGYAFECAVCGSVEVNPSHDAVCRSCQELDADDDDFEDACTGCLGHGCGLCKGTGYND